MTDLTPEELAELSDQLTVSDNPDEYVCGRCHADFHMLDDRSEPSALCDSCAQVVAGDVTPALIAMARDLIRLRSAMDHVERSDDPRGEASFPCGCRPEDVYAVAESIGWTDPKAGEP